MLAVADGDLQPHKRLLLRVWWRAVCDYVLYSGHRAKELRLLADDAATWLFASDEEDDEGITFPNFCQEFNQSPTRLRRWMRELSVHEINRIGRNLP